MPLLLQSAAQQIPPIYVTVQPKAGSLPEWVMVLISAGVGALLGVVSNIGMEFIKPYITNLLHRRTIGAQLGAEFTHNMGVLDAGVTIARVINDTGDKALFVILGQLFKAATLDRYKQFFESDKVVVYEIDKLGELNALYAILEHLRDLAKDDNHISDITNELDMAGYLGSSYASAHKLDYKSSPSYTSTFKLWTDMCTSISEKHKREKLVSREDAGQTQPPVEGGNKQKA